MTQMTAPHRTSRFKLYTRSQCRGALGFKLYIGAQRRGAFGIASARVSGCIHRRDALVMSIVSSLSTLSCVSTNNPTQNNTSKCSQTTAINNIIGHDTHQQSANEAYTRSEVKSCDVRIQPDVEESQTGSE